jgi:hypothetical protein
MDTNNLRDQTHELIDQVDEQFLQAIHHLLTTYAAKEASTVVGYDIHGTPKYAEETIALYEKRLQVVEAGERVTLDELKKEAKEWRTGTR